MAKRSGSRSSTTRMRKDRVPKILRRARRVQRKNNHLKSLFVRRDIQSASISYSYRNEVRAPSFQVPKSRLGLGPANGSSAWRSKNCVHYSDICICFVATNHTCHDEVEYIAPARARLQPQKRSVNPPQSLVRIKSYSYITRAHLIALVHPGCWV